MQTRIPKHAIVEFSERKTTYCVCIPVINEGDRLMKQLQRMHRYSKTVDIIIADGGSTDGSVNELYLKKHGVRTLLIKHDQGRLSAQLRIAFSYALHQGYKGIITIDGNGKDDPSAIPSFINALDQGYDFIQGSRFIRGGKAVNTPFSRLLGIKYIHAPIVSLAARFLYTDTTNGFRGHSSRYLLDKQLSIFRNIFDTYELLVYLSIRPKQLGYKIKEVPVTRSYPGGEIPTKIHGMRGNIQLLSILLNAILGKYNPTENEK